MTDNKIASPIDPSEDILEEALRICHADRENDYGPAEEDHRRVAAMWRAAFGWDVAPWHIGMAMILVKLSRGIHKPTKRDTWVDIPGYSRCAWKCIEAEGLPIDKDDLPDKWN